MGVTRYCMPTPITLDTIQYMDSPIGNWTEKKAIIIGIIQSIIVWFDCCFGSVDGLTVNFCWTQVETNTNPGISTIAIDSGLEPKSKPMKEAFNGAAECTGTTGIQEYSFSDNPTSSFGWENTV